VHFLIYFLFLSSSPLLQGTLAIDSVGRPSAPGSRGLLKALSFSYGTVAYALSAAFAAQLAAMHLPRCFLCNADYIEVGFGRIFDNK